MVHQKVTFTVFGLLFVRGYYLDVFASYYEPWGYKYTPAGCTISYLTSDVESLGDYTKCHDLDLIVLCKT